MTLRQLNRYTYRTARHRGLTMQQAEYVRHTVRTIVLNQQHSTDLPPFAHVQSKDTYIQSTLHQEINRYSPDHQL